jgi:hypothetical protein
VVALLGAFSAERGLKIIKNNGLRFAFGGYTAHQILPVCSGQMGNTVSTSRAIFGEGVICLLCKVERKLLS